MLSIEYVAGFFDGEGCVYISPNGRLQVSVTQKRPQILRKFRRMFNGRIGKNQRVNSAYRWTICSKKDCLNFLRAIRPHTFVKRAEIDLGIEIAELITSDISGCRPLTEDEWEARLSVRGRMQLIRPTTTFGNLNSEEKIWRDNIKEKCDWKCQRCGKDLSDFCASDQVITKEEKLICRSCNVTRYDRTQKAMTKEDIENAMEGRSLDDACEILGINRSSLYQKRKKFGLGVRKLAKKI